MSLNYPNIIGAAGKISGAGAVAWEAGGAAARTGAGVYTITLDNPADAAQSGVHVTLTGAAAAADLTVNVADTSDTVKTVSITAAGVATDEGFTWMLLRAPG